MDAIQKLIFKIFSEKGVADMEEYDLKVSRIDMTSELIRNGFDKEAVDRAIEGLCADGTLAMDEQGVYLYDYPPRDV